jgi:hypothetical protein
MDDESKNLMIAIDTLGSLAECLHANPSHGTTEMHVQLQLVRAFILKAAYQMQNGRSLAEAAVIAADVLESPPARISS